uniref:Uncharacterized protein n=1 Tax=Solanum lycopersicum TaxID=4081 RepID=K4D4Y7_SOLLC
MKTALLHWEDAILEKHHQYGNVHAVEKLRQSIEIWYATSEYLRQEMNPLDRRANKRYVGTTNQSTKTDGMKERKSCSAARPEEDRPAPIRIDQLNSVRLMGRRLLLLFEPGFETGLRGITITATIDPSRPESVVFL